MTTQTLDLPSASEIETLEEATGHVLSELDVLKSGLATWDREIAGELDEADAGRVLLFALGMIHAGEALAEESREIVKLVESIHVNGVALDPNYHARLAEWYESRAAELRS